MRWQQETGSPYGFFGVTVDPLGGNGAPLDRTAVMINAITGDLLSANERRLVISIVPILIVYPFVQKHFTKGLMIGAVKG